MLHRLQHKAAQARCARCVLLRQLNHDLLLGHSRQDRLRPFSGVGSCHRTCSSAHATLPALAHYGCRPGGKLCLTAPAHSPRCWRHPVALRMSRLLCSFRSRHLPHHISLQLPRLACSSGSLSSTTTHWAARLACSLAKASNVACSEALPAGEAVRPSSCRSGEGRQGQNCRQTIGGGGSDYAIYFTHSCTH